MSALALPADGNDPLALLGRAFDAQRHGAPPHVEHVLRWHDGSEATVKVARWIADPTPEELALLDRVRGPVLDVGCGPGRHVSELQRRGIPALGVDVLPEAVRFARARGARALQRSVFAPLPDTGRWRTALLLDGNVGIGGDPAALLRRIHALLGAGGIVLLEAEEHGIGLRCGTCRLETPAGSSTPFRWGRVGIDAVDTLAAACGFTVSDAWTVGGRWFAQLTADHRPTVVR
ncbi:MAG TPA: methyltransferase domain-containing protein [Solirubrobacteraceae bacterium]|nr:methyltransferase domain-containing protein [Solirubrobacteraceae bacterium]